MPLASSLFRNNDKLQACAVQNSAHVVVGAVGEHVAKIQFALFAIDRLNIDRSELLAQRYGTSTAAAVLAYKTKRVIINRSYQQVADNIVGKMTIASLDTDMQLRERVPTSGSDCVPGAIGAATAAGASSIVPRASGVRDALGVGPTAPTVATRQLGGVVRIVVLFASNAAQDGFPLGREITRARDCLTEHGVQLVVERSIGVTGVVQFVERVLVNPLAAGDNVNELRKRCEDLVPGQPGVLRVIVCHLGNFDFGHTIRNRSVGSQRFLPFALLNTEQVDVSNATLIHEMVHCSKPGIVDHDREEHSVFSAFGTVSKGKTERTALRAEHALTIASSFFSIGGPPPKP
ncbi:MAG: hypothetical protein H7099_02395 [Gemmatimonadaceae bacterium]|nr:hypothetical protein [Gemmatimonadaceae bacterium]